MEKKIKYTIGLCALLISATSTADKIPTPLLKSLNELNRAYPVVLEKGVLSVALKFDEIEALQARSVVQSMCLSYMSYDGKGRTWKAGAVDTVRIINETISQGFIYQGGDKSCEGWFKSRGDSGDEYLNEKLSRVTFKLPQ
ncbi:hypothetical protein [Dickeya solani]|uniref:Uncharacterized protein n=1 Tax=Dickeya solani TaxID=1089444 RepID=A0AAX4F3V0_9GAMM|nr:hypothetical protein [Dickeya solani]WOA54384.1 hypothetical protein RXA29_09295 [Dickeya solani]